MLERLWIDLAGLSRLEKELLSPGQGHAQRLPGLVGNIHESV
jgi:hypothetical protein